MFNVRTEIVASKAWLDTVDVNSLSNAMASWVLLGLTDGVRHRELLPDGETRKITRYWLNDTSAQLYFDNLSNLDSAISYEIINP